MNLFTKSDLLKMWERPVERQYDIALCKVLQAILATKGDISICFSGGKDSSLLLDMVADIWKSTPYADLPIKVKFANTTNETSAMLKFIDSFIPWIEQKYDVKIDFAEVKPPNNLTWVSFIMQKGLPLISKSQSKAIRAVREDMRKTGCDYDTVTRLAKAELACVNELFDIGFSKTGVLSLTGWVSCRSMFGKHFMLSKRWLPMVNGPVDLTEQCCVKIKETALGSLHEFGVMTGEQAAESQSREAAYLKTGCNIRLSNGIYKSKPLGAMTQDGVLFALKYRETPICDDYGEILFNDGHYTCSKACRTGCALCGFGCQYDTERFIRLQETEPAKVKFAFKPLSQGGAGYAEAIQYMNEYCSTAVKIPNV